MSKILLSCNDYLYCNNGRFYAANQDKFDFYQRYLRVFEQLRLVARCEEEPVLKAGRVPLDLDGRIEFIPVPMFHGPKEYVLEYRRVGKELRCIIEGCDAAICRLPSTVAMRVCEQVKKSGIPYAVEIVACSKDFKDVSKSFVNKVLWYIQDKKIRSLCNKADGVSCVTEKYLQQYYFSTKNSHFESSYSSLAIDSSFYTEPRELNKNPPYYIVHVANQVRLQGEKGHKESVDIIRILKDRGFDVRIIFVGASYFKGAEALADYAKEVGVLDRVEFPGFMSRENLQKCLEASDLLLLPTRTEGLPRVVIEAMAKGLPCLSTPVGGIPELLDVRYLVDYEDVETFANRIAELLTNKQIYDEVSFENFERSKKYKAHILQNKRDEFYRKLKEIIK